MRLIALGALAAATSLACSDDPAPASPLPKGGSGGASGGSGGNTSGGAFGASGSNTKGGTGGMTSGGGGNGGSGGTTAGANSGGVSGGGMGGTTAGTGGMANPPLDCSTQTGKALPITLSSTWGFPDSGDDSYTETMLAGGNDACTTASAPEGAQGCWSLKWTPTSRTYVHWYWHNTAANWTGRGVCVATGAKAVTLKVKGDSAFNAKFVAAGVEKTVEVTTAWQDVVIDISGVNYNTVNAQGGVNTGLAVVMERLANDTTARTVYFYDVQWAADANGGGGGEGGAGGAGG